MYSYPFTTCSNGDIIFENEKEFAISHIEQIKALPKLKYNDETGKIEKIGSMEYYDKLVIPIIENTPHEEDLTDSLQEAIKNYPGASAVLVRRHGIYVWVKPYGRQKFIMKQLIIY